MSSREIIPEFAGEKNASPATEIEGEESKEDEISVEKVECTPPVERTPTAEQESDTIDEVWCKVTVTGENMISSSKDGDDLPRIDEETEGKHAQLLVSQGEQQPLPPLDVVGGLDSGKAKKKVTMHDGAGSTSANIHLMIDGDTGSKSANAKIGGGLKASHSIAASISTLENLLNDPVGKNGNHSRGNSPKENGSSNISPEAWERLTKAFVYYKGKPVGAVAAMDPIADALNYNQVFIRDFVPCGLACLMRESREDWDVVKNFLLKTLHLQHHLDKRVDRHTLAKGAMPASFEVGTRETNGEVVVLPDYGGKAIGRVAPIDSGFWWIILLKAYTKRIGNRSLSELPGVQRGIKDILNLCLAEGFDSCPTFLCADGCCMIDRRMGMYGYPIEIQALFFYALKCAKQLLIPEHGANELISLIDKRISALSYHIQNYYWLDFTQLNNIYRYKTEEYSHTAVNKFNVMPESIPGWVFDFMPLHGGYFIGNVGPSRMDFRWFSVGNFIAILSSLATPEQENAIMDLVEAHWTDLIGEMPIKISYPALQGHDWRIVTGCDPKNTAWSYHNGGSWPVLLWLLTAASIKTGRPHIAKRAIEVAEKRLAKDGWPEYYDGKTGRFVGKQARKYQTWSIAGYLVAKLLIENPANIGLFSSLEEDRKKVKPKLVRSASWPSLEKL